MADVTLYTDLALVHGSGEIGDGSAENPFSKDEWLNDASADRATENTTYKLKNGATFSSLIFAGGVYSAVYCGNRAGLTIESWESEPARIYLLSESTQTLTTLGIITISGTGPTVLNRLIIGSNCANKTATNYVGINSYAPLLIKNCSIVPAQSSGMTLTTKAVVYSSGSYNVTIYGSDLQYYGGNGSGVVVLSGDSTRTLTVDSCYTEGPVNYVLIANPGTTGTYRNCIFYQVDSEFGGTFISTVSGNISAASDGTNIVILDAGGGGREYPDIKLLDYNSLTQTRANLTPKQDHASRVFFHGGSTDIGLTVDLWDASRYDPDIGSTDGSNYINVLKETALITPNNPTIPNNDGTSVTSVVNLSYLTSKIQSDSTDGYFNGSEDFFKVLVEYAHQAGRQAKTIRHKLQDSGKVEGPVEWSTNAQDGTWEKRRIKSEDFDGAVNIMGQSAIGSSENLVI